MKCATVTKPKESSAKQPKILKYCDDKTIQAKDKEKIMEACISVCTTDLRPLCIFEGVGIRNFANTLIQLGAKYGQLKAEEVLPARTTISKKILSKSNNAIISDIEKCSDAANASHTPCVENEHSYDMLKVMHPKKSFTSDLSEFEDDIISSNKQAPTDEVTMYLNSSFPEDYVAGLSDENVVGGLNLLLFWKAKANQFPSLSALAKCILCIPASSASSERAFSTSGRVFEERRTRLGLIHWMQSLRCTVSTRAL